MYLEMTQDGNYNEFFYLIQSYFPNESILHTKRIKCKTDRMMTGFKGLLTKSYKMLQPHGIARSRDTRKPLHLYYQIGYDHQIWEDGGLP